MTNWKEDLEKKAIELNIKKEEKNGSSTQGNSRLRDRSSSGRGRDADLSNIRKEKLNNVRGGELMISKEGALRDIDGIVSKGEYIDRETKKTITLNSDLEKLGAIVKVLIVFLNSMRSNQLLPETEKARIYTERKNRKETNKQ